MNQRYTMKFTHYKSSREFISEKTCRAVSIVKYLPEVDVLFTVGHNNPVIKWMKRSPNYCISGSLKKDCAITPMILKSLIKMWKINCIV